MYNNIKIEKMKKVFMLVLLVIISIQVAVGQHRGSPILPYNENGYTISHVRSFVLAENQLSLSYKDSLLLFVNKALEEAGEKIRFSGTEQGIDSLLSHVYYEERILPSFGNSMRIGSKIEFYSDYGFRGTVGIFEYGRCRLILFKTICLNLLKVPVEILEEKVAEDSPPPPADTLKTKPETKPETKTEFKIIYSHTNSPYRPIQKTPVNNLVKKKNPWKIVCVVGGITITIGAAYFIYTLFRKGSSAPGEPGGAPVGNGGSGNPGGTPSGDGSAGGAPV